MNFTKFKTGRKYGSRMIQVKLEESLSRLKLRFSLGEFYLSQEKSRAVGKIHKFMKVLF